MPEQQTFFYSNTHHSTTHENHKPVNTPVATEWNLGVRNDNRQSGFNQYKPLGHTDFVGQTNLNMFNGGQMNLPNDLDR